MNNGMSLSIDAQRAMIPTTTNHHQPQKKRKMEQQGLNYVMTGVSQNNNSNIDSSWKPSVKNELTSNCRAFVTPASHVGGGGGPMKFQGKAAAASGSLSNISTRVALTTTGKSTTINATSYPTSSAAAAPSAEQLKSQRCGRGVNGRDGGGGGGGAAESVKMKLSQVDRDGLSQADRDGGGGVSQGGEVVIPRESHYQGKGVILSPGQSVLTINKLTMGQDKKFSDEERFHRPGVASCAAYVHDMFLQWMKYERSMERGRLCVLFDGKHEEIRVQCVAAVFCAGSEDSLSMTTIQSCIYNFHQSFHHLDANSTRSNVLGMLMACFRVSLKHEEAYPTSHRCLKNGRVLNELAKSLKMSPACTNMKDVNITECALMEWLFDHGVVMPAPSDFIERFLTVGGWPKDFRQRVRGCALYFCNLMFFNRGWGLEDQRVAPSFQAALCVSLAVRVCNTEPEKFDPWPLKLKEYTTYSAATVRAASKPIIQILKEKSKPLVRDILVRFHPEWASSDWS